MLLYRSAVLGLLCALLLLVATRETARPAAAPGAAVVVDVSRAAMNAAGLGPEALIAVRPGERIASVDGVAGAGALGAAWRAARDGGFVDVELASRDARRRVLLLVHR
jgi:hypothetical protein